MTRKPNPPELQTPIMQAEYGYVLEKRICLTPDKEDGLHTHVTIRIDSSTGTARNDKDAVMAKTHADFKQLLDFMLEEDAESNLDSFIESLAMLDCYSVAPMEPEPELDDAASATHPTAEKIQ